MNNLNNKSITNIFINNKYIKLRTNNAIFINLPNHGNHIGWWLNKVFVYPSKKYIDYTAIGIKKNNTFTIWKYDLELHKHQYLKLDIKLIEKFGEMRNKANDKVQNDKTINKLEFGKKIGYFNALVVV